MKICLILILTASFLITSCGNQEPQRVSSNDNLKDQFQIDSSSFPDNYRKTIFIEDGIENILIDSLQYKIQIKHISDKYVNTHKIDTVKKIDSIFLFNKIDQRLESISLRTYPNAIEIGQWKIFKANGNDSIIDKEKGLKIDYFDAIKIAANLNFKLPNIEFYKSTNSLGNYKESIWIIERLAKNHLVDSVLIIGTRSGFVGSFKYSDPQIIPNKTLNEYHEFIKGKVLITNENQ